MKFDLEKMRQQALAVMQQAYAPYSNFKVGACILGQSGELYVGCNVENSSYGLTSCAEAGAISSMVASSERSIEAAVIVCSGDDFCPPCGACRQRLQEFSSDVTKIYLFNKLGQQRNITMLELLPFPFDKDFLEES